VDATARQHELLPSAGRTEKASWYLWLILLAPLLLVGLFAVMLGAPWTRPSALWLLRENHPVEIATALFLVCAGAASVARAWVARRGHEAVLTQAFFLVFGVGLVVTGMEEAAWGQYWLGFETPAALAEINVKGEATLHNIAGLDGRTEILRVLYGLGGLIGVWLGRRGRLVSVTPPTVLWTWFATIAFLSSYDLINDVTPLTPALDSLVFHLNELVEMLVGLSALIFVAMKLQESRSGAAQNPSLNSSRVDATPPPM
jgi:hypothetical protein